MTHSHWLINAMSFVQWIEVIGQGKTPCLFQLLTGYYCPGCGGTRAVTALMRGRLLLSFFYHPFVLFAAVISLIFLLSWVISKITGGNKRLLHFNYANIYVGMGIIAVNFLVKNIALGFWGVELLGLLDKGW